MGTEEEKGHDWWESDRNERKEVEWGRGKKWIRLECKRDRNERKKAKWGQSKRDRIGVKGTGMKERKQNGDGGKKGRRLE